MKMPVGGLKLLTIGVAVIGAAPGARADSGYNYPICLHVYGPITYDECRYTSIEQCAPSASGRPAQCIVNPFYGLNNRPPPRRSRY